MDIPYVGGEYLKRVELRLNKQIFEDTAARGIYDLTKGNFYVAFHYPSQFLTSSIRALKIPYNLQSIQANSGRNGELNKIAFTIEHMEVLRRRNKRTENCNSAWRTHDQYFREHITRAVGCTPPQFDDNKSSRTCSDRKQLSRFNHKFHDKIGESDFFVKPCLSIEKMFYRHEEIRKNIVFSLYTWIPIVIEFEDSIYKEIKYVQGTEIFLNHK